MFSQSLYVSLQLMQNNSNVNFEYIFKYCKKKKKKIQVNMETLKLLDSVDQIEEVKEINPPHLVVRDRFDLFMMVVQCTRNLPQKICRKLTTVRDGQGDIVHLIYFNFMLIILRELSKNVCGIGL